MNCVCPTFRGQASRNCSLLLKESTGFIWKRWLSNCSIFTAKTLCFLSFFSLYILTHILCTVHHVKFIGLLCALTKIRRTGEDASSELWCLLLVRLQHSAHCQVIHRERDVAFRVKSAFQTCAPILSRKQITRRMPVCCRWDITEKCQSASVFSYPQQNILNFSEIKNQWQSSQIQSSYMIMGWVHKNEIIAKKIMET